MSIYYIHVAVMIELFLLLVLTHPGRRGTNNTLMQFSGPINGDPGHLDQRWLSRSQDMRIPCRKAWSIVKGPRIASGHYVPHILIRVLNHPGE